MKIVDYLIIGGGVAGTTAAETLRQENASCSVAIVSDEPYRLYSRILISKPNFFFGKIPFDQIYLKNESWYQENKIELITGRNAVSLDRGKKTVKLDDGMEIQYGRLLLAIGGHARHWNVPGAEKKGVCYFRTLDHTKEMMANFKLAKRGLTIGSGFVSFETTELMRQANIDTTVVMLEPYFWYPLFDEVSGKMIEAAMEKAGVKLLRQSEVKEVVGEEHVSGVILKDGTKLECEIIGVGIGVMFDFGWLTKAGVAINKGILADEYLKTNDEDIFTAGDCAEFTDLILGEKVQLGSWANALNQGAAAARNMLGQAKPFRLVSFYNGQAFGMSVSIVGDVRVSEGKKIINRASPKKNSYLRMIVKDGLVQGATLLNGAEELFALSNLIEKRINISEAEDKLADPDFDLGSLILQTV